MTQRHRHRNQRTFRFRFRFRLASVASAHATNFHHRRLESREKEVGSFLLSRLATNNKPSFGMRRMRDALFINKSEMITLLKKAKRNMRVRMLRTVSRYTTCAISKPRRNS